jgi:hypothetical protein
MKVKYEQSKIYKISNKEGDYFIDRTTDSYLSKRLVFLRKSFEKYQNDKSRSYEPYFKLFENKDELSLALIENFKCEDIKTLKTRLDEIVKLEENQSDKCLNNMKTEQVKKRVSKYKCPVCKIDVALNQKNRHEGGKFHKRFLDEQKEPEVPSTSSS